MSNTTRFNEEFCREVGNSQLAIYFNQNVNDIEVLQKLTRHIFPNGEHDPDGSSKYYLTEDGKSIDGFMTTRLPFKHMADFFLPAVSDGEEGKYDFQKMLQEELGKDYPMPYEQARAFILDRLEEKYSDHPIIKYLRNLQEVHYKDDVALWNQVNRIVHNILEENILSLHYPSPTSAHLKTGSEAYVFDIEDAINKISTLNEYCRSFGLGKKVPHELYAVVEECDEFLKSYKNQPKVVITGGGYEIVKSDTVSCEPKN